MRESLIDSMRIIWALISPFIYFYSAWSFYWDGLEIEPLTYSITSFSMSIKSILFFHARKFDDPTCVLLSLQNEVTLIVDLDININIHTLKVKMLLDDDIFNLMPSWWCCFLDDLLQGCLRCDIFLNEREITLMMKCSFFLLPRVVPSRWYEPCDEMDSPSWCFLFLLDDILVLDPYESFFNWMIFKLPLLLVTFSLIPHWEIKGI